jgi:hypothetical protein
MPRPRLQRATTARREKVQLHIREQSFFFTSSVLDVPSWARFLQILEDTGPAWMVAVLYTTSAQNITTRDDLKNLLTVTDPGGAVPVSGGLDEWKFKIKVCFDWFLWIFLTYCMLYFFLAIAIN